MEEREERLRRRREHYRISSERQTDEGSKDVTLSHTTKSSAILHYRMMVQCTRVSCNVTLVRQSARATVDDVIPSCWMLLASV